MTRSYWAIVFALLILSVGCQDAATTGISGPTVDPERVDPSTTNLPSANSVTIDLAEPTQDAPVSWGAALDRNSVAAGEAALLVVRAKILDGWHIYAAKGDTGVSKPTKLNLTLPAGIAAVDDWALPLAEVKSSPLGQISHHKKLATFSIPVKVDGHTTAQEASIVCDVDFQSCTETGCLPPTSQQLTIPITVTN